MEAEQNQNRTGTAQSDRIRNWTGVGPEPELNQKLKPEQLTGTKEPNGVGAEWNRNGTGTEPEPEQNRNGTKEPERKNRNG
jgi:hypothetical protein